MRFVKYQQGIRREVAQEAVPVKQRGVELNIIRSLPVEQLGNFLLELLACLGAASRQVKAVQYLLQFQPTSQAGGQHFRGGADGY